MQEQYRDFKKEADRLPRWYSRMFSNFSAPVSRRERNGERERERESEREREREREREGEGERASCLTTRVAVRLKAKEICVMSL